jgi:glutamyl-tRNA synthetase
MFNLFKPKIRTRFAPSPTGYLHIGGLRTALYAYLFARQNKGTFVLRVEDTDQTREVAGAVEGLVKALKLVGLNPDEGVLLTSKGKVAQKGNFGPYTQSQRVRIYQEYAQKLLKKGLAYYCFCTPERLESLRQLQAAAKKPTHYDWHCRHFTAEEVKQRLAAGEKHVIRLKVPENKEIEFTDGVYGKIKISSKEIDDQVLVKSDGFPTYHLANVIDDHLMKITHVIRGEEWLPSTPKHILLYSFFNWPSPNFYHLPLLINADRSKLSKRQGDVAVEDYLNQGYLPAAIVNFVALLGWNPGTEQEIFSLPELIKQFDLSRVHKAAAVFNRDKLDWFNHEYLLRLSLDEFARLAQPFWEKKFGSLPENWLAVARVEQERISKLSDIGNELKFVTVQKLSYDSKILIWKKSTPETILKNLELLKESLNKIGEWTKENIENEIKNFISQNKLSNGEVLWPLRVALTGQEKSPTPFEVAAMLGQQKSLARLQQAIELLK